MVAVCWLSLSLLTATWTNQLPTVLPSQPTTVVQQSQGLTQIHRVHRIVLRYRWGTPVAGGHHEHSLQHSTGQSVWPTTTVYKTVSMAILVLQPQQSTGWSVMANHNSPLDGQYCHPITTTVHWMVSNGQPQKSTG